MISGKAFADSCKWVIDSRYPGRAVYWQLRAKTGDSIFVNGDLVMNLVNVLSLSKRKYVFVIHNSDIPFDEVRLNALLPYAIHINAINTIVKHPKLTTIPLGFPDAGVVFLSTFVKPEGPRTIEYYMNFSMGTNVDKRAECYDVFKNDPRVVIRSNVSRKQYHEDLCRSKYVLCPEGAGIDTHRIYEAIYCGATPIVLRNALADLYASYPVKIVDSWSEVI